MGGPSTVRCVKMLGRMTGVGMLKSKSGTSDEDGGQTQLSPLGNRPDAPSFKAFGPSLLLAFE